MNEFSEIINWNINRNNTTYDSTKELMMLVEELQEFENATTDDEEVDALCDLMVICAGALYKKGYCPTLSLQETIKEISSRKQCAVQKDIWDKWGASGKWQKSATQSSDTLYVADYEKARL
jgi:hypothetical protein